MYYLWAKNPKAIYVLASAHSDKLYFFHREDFNYVSWNQNQTKAITIANHRKRKQHISNENLKQVHVTGAKRGKTRVTKSWLVLVLHLIGWQSGARFLNQS